MNNQDKGLLYEIYVKDFIIQKLSKNAYLWNECPENILIDNNLIDSHNDMRLLRKDLKEGHLHNHKDIGIDIIQINNDKISIVQCKNGYNNGLCVDDIAGIMMRSAFIRDVNTFIYYTSCLSRNIRYTTKLSPYVVNIDCSNNINGLLEVSDDNKIYFVKLPYETITNEDIITPTEIVPYSFQIEADNKFEKHFQTNNRGILSLPCGCGKTLIGSLVSNRYKHIIILSPLREFAKQNLNRFIEYGYNANNTLLVDSDGNRDLDSIKEFIKGRDKLLISCTYDSMDLIAECLDLFKNALFIIDEFHNLSKTNITNEDNPIFKLLMSNHKILFMSATPRIYDIEYDDEESIDTEYLFGEVVYQMTFTDAIANKYITDYKIWLPSIHENNEDLDKELSIYEIDNDIKNRCKFLYSCIANNGSRKCIIYCKDTEDMNTMMESMKVMNDFYIMDIEMDSISCKDSEKNRKNVLNNFANNDKIQLLFNIMILNECIDIPACDSIYISYAPKNKITTIQRMNRATRTDKKNPYKVANIYIWCDEYEEILETLSSIKEYDIMFNDKIKINSVNFYHSKDENAIKIIEDDKVLLSNCIVGIKEFRSYTWEDKLEMVKAYIEENGKLPSQKDKNKKIKNLSTFWSKQKKEYIDNKLGEKHKVLWKLFINEYSYLTSLFKVVNYEEDWKNKLNQIKIYINTNNKLPSSYDKDIYVKKLGKWLCGKKTDYKKKKDIMSRTEIRVLWEEFIEQYSKYFISKEELWKTKIDIIVSYILQYNKLPSSTDKIKDIQNLSCWLSKQKQNYIDQKEIMKNIDIRIIWEKFIEKYYNYFKINEDIWLENLKKVKDYIILYNILPSSCDEDKNIKYLGLWLINQKKKYEKNEYIMKQDNIRNLWENFIEEYISYFKTNEELWINNLEMVKEYIEKYNKLPIQKSKNIENETLANWIATQKQNYKNNTKIMKEENIKILWKNFIEKYKEYFLSNEEKWLYYLQETEIYIQNNNKIPSQQDNNQKLKTLANWVSTQKNNYKDNCHIMKDEKYKKIWEKFIEKYKEYFLSNEEKWLYYLKETEIYIQNNNKIPSYGNKDKHIQKIGKWLAHQKENYDKKEQIMSNDNIRNIWSTFINKYEKYFKSNEELWIENLNNVKEHIKKYNEIPSQNDKNQIIKTLSNWINMQKQKYKNKKGILKNENIRKEWEDFIEKYKEYFLSNEEKWLYYLKETEIYIQNNNKIPSRCINNQSIEKLGCWIQYQKKIYIKQLQIMKDPIIRKTWKDFAEKYQHLF